MMRPMQEGQQHRIKAKLDSPTMAFLQLVRKIKLTMKIMDSVGDDVSNIPEK
jgi:hypothetical protein